MQIHPVDFCLLVIVLVPVRGVVKSLVMVFSVVVVRTILYVVTVIVVGAGVTLTVERVVAVTTSGYRSCVLVLRGVGTCLADVVPIWVRHETLVLVVLSPPTATPSAVVSHIQAARRVLPYIPVLKTCETRMHHSSK